MTKVLALTGNNGRITGPGCQAFPVPLMSHHSRPAPFGKYMGTNLLGEAAACARAARGISDSKTGNARATPAPRNTLRLEIVFFIWNAPCPKRASPPSWVPTPLAERVVTNELLDEVPK